MAGLSRHVPSLPPSPGLFVWLCAVSRATVVDLLMTTGRKALELRLIHDLSRKLILF